MALTTEQRQKIIAAAIDAYKKGKPLFPPKPKPTQETKLTPETEDALYAQMQKLGGTIR
jgi:hypothetical protein